MEGLVRLSELLRDAGEHADKEMHRYAKSHSDHMARIAFLEKGRSGSLATAPLESLMTAQLMESSGLAGVVADTDYLQTVLIVVPKSATEAFWAQYESMDAVSVPITDASGSQMGASSPVVPRSALHLLTERDYSLFSFTILRKFFDSVAAAAKKHRWVLRSVDWSAAGASDTAEQLSRLHADASSALQLWAAAAHRTFASLISIQVHLKVLQVFVESVLNYGLPAEYSYCLMRVHHSTAQQAAQAVQAATNASDATEASEENAADAALLASTAGPSEGAGQPTKESNPAAALAYTLPCVAVPLVVSATVHVGR
jgi:V-type H+-transporting ATPase subunit C